jgi:hypothetical protein
LWSAAGAEAIAMISALFYPGGNFTTRAFTAVIYWLNKLNANDLDINYH